MLSNRDVTSRHVNIFESFTIIGCQNKFSTIAENVSSLALNWHTKNQLGYTQTPGICFRVICLGMSLKVNDASSIYKI